MQTVKLKRSSIFIATLLVAIAVSFVGVRPASAIHKDPKNAYEKYVTTCNANGFELGKNFSVCNVKSSGQMIGTIWATGSASDVYGSDDPNDIATIKVPYDRQYVTVYIRGSIYGHKTDWASSTSAHRIRDITEIIEDLSSTTVNRGNFGWDQFSDPPQYITGKIDISKTGLGSEPGSSVIVTPKLFRCPYADSPDENCGISYVPIRLYREAAPWTATGSTNVKTDQTGKTGWESGANAYDNVRPGTTATWRHAIKNNGESSTPRVVVAKVLEQYGDLVDGRNWGYDARLGDTTRWTSDKLGGSKGGWILQAGNATFTRQITQSYVGKKLCQRVTWTPRAGTDTGAGYSSHACVNVPYHYPGCKGSGCTNQENPGKDDCTFSGSCSSDDQRKTGGNGVTPSTTANKTEVEVGSSVTFQYNLTNKGPTKSKPINYKVYGFILKGGESLPSNWDSASAYPKDWGSRGVGCGGRSVTSSKYRNGKCELLLEGSLSTVVPGSSLSGWPQNKTINVTSGSGWLAEPGDQICSYMAVDRWSVYNGVEADTYAASNIKCVKVGKKPQIQINGADSIAENGYEGSTHGGGFTARGSYSQYGLLTASNSGAVISNFGSADFSVLGSADNSKKLSFANTNSTTLGNADLDFVNGDNISTPSVPATVESRGGSSINLSTLPAGTHYYRVNTGSGSLTVTGSLPTNSRVTIFASGDILINGNIDASTNGDSFTSLTNLSNLTLVSTNGNIAVSGSVDYIYGTFVAQRGRFISCSDSTVAAGSSDTAISLSGVCNRKLKIVGAVVSEQTPLLRRTFGGGNGTSIQQYDGSQSSTTAEWFNYSAASWLAPYLNGSTGITGFTTNTTSGLPVRY
ncbi:MAG: hypothetical protein Q4C83_02465 [Candidatus Saccharibacteria bacterium]|nr:hypothetical protein [Candidatus Saccharibacteria bacterium]